MISGAIGIAVGVAGTVLLWNRRFVWGHTLFGWMNDHGPYY
jgi:hypothetical protein